MSWVLPLSSTPGMVAVAVAPSRRKPLPPKYVKVTECKWFLCGRFEIDCCNLPTQIEKICFVQLSADGGRRSSLDTR